MYLQNANAMRSVKNSPFFGQYSANPLYFLNPAVWCQSEYFCVLITPS